MSDTYRIRPLEWEQFKSIHRGKAWMALSPIEGLTIYASGDGFEFSDKRYKTLDEAKNAAEKVNQDCLLPALVRVEEK